MLHLIKILLCCPVSDDLTALTILKDIGLCHVWWVGSAVWWYL